MGFAFPRIYPILDSSIFGFRAVPAQERGKFLEGLGRELADAGVTLLEFRSKSGSDAEILENARALRRSMPAPNIKLILDDRVDLVGAAGFDGVHVDAGDVVPQEARRLLGPNAILGTFGGPAAAGGGFLPGALQEPVDYLAIGPFSSTQTKQTSNPLIGPEGVRRLRVLAGPGRVLTVAGGITLATAAEVLEAGGSAVAVSAAIFRTDDPGAEFRRWAAALA